MLGALANFSRYCKVSTSLDLAYFRYSEAPQHVGEGAEGEVPLPAPQSTRDKADADIRKYHKKWPIEDSLYFHF